MADTPDKILPIISTVTTFLSSTCTWLLTSVPLTGMVGISILLIEGELKVEATCIITFIVTLLSGMAYFVFLNVFEWSTWNSAFAIVFAEFCIVVAANVIGWGVWLIVHWRQVFAKGRERWARLGRGGHEAGGDVQEQLGLTAMVVAPVKELD